MKTIDTVQEFETLLQSGQPFVVDFYADWCGPCNQMLPVVEDIAETSDVPFYKVNIDTAPEVKERNKIKAIPMLIMFNEGRVREFAYGVTEKEKIVNKLERLTQ